MATVTFYPNGFTSGPPPTPVAPVAVVQGESAYFFLQFREQPAPTKTHFCYLYVDGDFWQSGYFGVQYLGYDGTYYSIYKAISDVQTAAWSTGLHTWSISVVDSDNHLNSSDSFTFEVLGGSSAPSKASNPSPADTATEVDFSTPTLSWDGDGDTYDVWGGAAGNWVKLAEGISNTYYTLSESEKTLFKNGVVTWRVDSTNEYGTTTGDDWTFDPRPGKPTNPTPSDTDVDISLSQVFSWDVATNADTYNVIIAGSTVSTGQADPSYTMDTDLLSYDEEYTWRVDAVNFYGTTTGTSWTFQAMNIDPIISTWESIDGGPGPLDGGEAGVDFRWTGLNNIITVKRVVAAAKDSFYFETS